MFRRYFRWPSYRPSCSVFALSACLAFATQAAAQPSNNNPYRGYPALVRQPAATPQPAAGAGPSQQTGRPAAPPPATQLAPPATQTAPAATNPPQSVLVDENASALSRQNLTARLEAAQSAKELDEAVKADLTKRLKAAIEAITIHEDCLKKLAAYQAEIDSAPSLIAQKRNELATPTPATDRIDVLTAGLEQLEARLEEASTALKAAQKTLADREEEVNRRTQRKTELTKLADEKRQRQEDLSKQLASPPPTGESAELVTAHRLELEAVRQMLTSQMALIAVETKRLDAIAELLPLRRDLSKREARQREQELTRLQAVVAEKRKRESARQTQEARRQLADGKLDPALRLVAEQNAVLAERRQKLLASITSVSQEVTAADKRFEQLKKDFKSFENKLKYAGHSSSFGLMMRKKRSELPKVAVCKERVRFVAAEMPAANLSRVELAETESGQEDLAAEVDRLLRATNAATPEEREASNKAAPELIAKQRELIDQLGEAYDDYLHKLSELEVSTKKLLNLRNEFEAYINKHVLWIRSEGALGPKQIVAAGSGLGAFIEPGMWWDVGRRLGLDAFSRSWMIGLVLMLASGLVLLRTRMQARVHALCEPVSGARRLIFAATLQGLMLCFLIAGTYPMLVLFAGWRLTQAGETEAAHAIGLALKSVALLVWISGFARQVCKPGGLGEAHLGWSQLGLRSFRSYLRWLTIGGVPMVFFVLASQHLKDGAWNESLGRLAFVTSMVLLAAFMYAVLYAKNNVLREIIACKPDGWLKRLRPLFFAGGVGSPLALAVLAGIGYYYSAQQLAFRLEITLASVLLLVAGHGLVSRWFLVRRRNLAIDRARLRAQDGDGAARESVIEAESTHEQLQYLLRCGIVVCVFVGGWLIWSDVLPALQVLDDVVLWWTKVPIAEVSYGQDGATELVETTKTVPTSLRHAFVAGLLLLATCVLATNLPALLEITVLDRLPFDRGARHAILVILRYVVAMVGLLLAFRMMRFSWTSVQWLAAGMTVGLGFGLQEIFANFVSGLVLLFERPIRVGDVITMGDTTGTVTNIRIRATTITNWDRKELIVPNKELITGRLLNWTLSDTMNRIVVTVGVAYKSDTATARELILGVACEHPQTLEEPAPNVTFEAFGESCLNFVLRCYVASMDVRLATIHELHDGIHSAFNEHGIEIAFPQMDLHVRTVEQAMTLSDKTIEGPNRAA